MYQNDTFFSIHFRLRVKEDIRDFLSNHHFSTFRQCCWKTTFFFAVEEISKMSILKRKNEKIRTLRDFVSKNVHYLLYTNNNKSVEIKE